MSTGPHQELSIDVSTVAIAWIFMWLNIASTITLRLFYIVNQSFIKIKDECIFLPIINRRKVWWVQGSQAERPPCCNRGLVFTIIWSLIFIYSRKLILLGLLLLRKLFDLFLTGKIELLHIVRLLFLLKEYCFLIKCLYHNVFDTIDMSFLNFL